MGVSTDGEISYGIPFDEDFEFPWDDELYDGDIEDWWRAVNGYKPPFNLYDERGEPIGGVRPSFERISEYFTPRDAFDKEHPIPVELVNAQSGEYPAYIIALKGTVLTASRGYPKAFDPASLIVTDDQRNTLIEFCNTHDIDIDDKEPHWYLSSYWG